MDLSWGRREWGWELERRCAPRPRVCSYLRRRELERRRSRGGLSGWEARRRDRELGTGEVRPRLRDGGRVWRVGSGMGMNETLGSEEYIHLLQLALHVRAGSAGLRARICYFPTRLSLPVGFKTVPAPVPAGTNWRPYPRPSGLVPTGTRVFSVRCHL